MGLASIRGFFTGIPNNHIRGTMGYGKAWGDSVPEEPPGCKVPYDAQGLRAFLSAAGFRASLADTIIPASRVEGRELERLVTESQLFIIFGGNLSRGLLQKLGIVPGFAYHKAADEPPILRTTSVGGVPHTQPLDSRWALTVNDVGVFMPRVDPETGHITRDYGLMQGIPLPSGRAYLLVVAPCHGSGQITPDIINEVLRRHHALGSPLPPKSPFSAVYRCDARVETGGPASGLEQYSNPSVVKLL